MLERREDRDSRWIDHAHHSRFAMAGVTAVEPDGFRVVDRDGEDIRVRAAGCLEGTAEEAGVVGQWLTRCCERGLCDGVRLWVEKELYC